MEPTSIGAARHYQIAKQALTPEGMNGTPKAGLEKTEASVLAKGLTEFSQVFENVESATQAMSIGQGDAHSVVEALATAEVALEAAVTIRNRVVEAYQELLRMPV